MYRLTVESSFAAAHNLRNYQGDCEKLHGHNWRVEVTVTAREIDHAGLAVDFKVLKRATRELMAELDHKYLNELPPFLEHSPSSENIARYLHGELGSRLNDGNVQVLEVTVWESDNARATYYEG